MTVSDFLKKENNNLDLIRIVAAIMVIIGHSYFLANAHGSTDPINSIFHFTYSGSLAVKIFFFVSGLLVTNSIIKTKNAFNFIISRFFRIYPAFALTILITAYIIGPIFSGMNYYNYMHDKWLDYYVINNLIMQINYNLPGLFGGNIHRLAVNGSLWTIPYEINSYLVLLAAFMVGALQNRKLFSLLCIIIILAPIFDFNNELFIKTPNAEAYLLPPCFA